MSSPRPGGGTSGPVAHAPRPVRRPLGPRFLVFGVAVVLVVTGLGLRIFELQVTQGSYYPTLSVQEQR